MASLTTGLDKKMSEALDVAQSAQSETSSVLAAANIKDEIANGINSFAQRMLYYAHKYRRYL